MIRSSRSFVNVSLSHLLRKLAVIVFCEVVEPVKVGLVDISLFSWEEHKYFVNTFLLILSKMVVKTIWGYQYTFCFILIDLLKGFG